MKVRDIFKNLTEYKSSDLGTISVRGRKYLTNRDITTPEVLVGLGFGVGDQYNQILAQTIRDERDFFGRNIDAYVQSEIAKELNYMGEKNLFQESDRYAKSNKRVSTINLLSDIQKDKKNVGYIFSAHPGHIFRVIEIAKKTGMGKRIFIPKEIIWPDNDPQEWVRSAEAWKRREPLVRIHHWLFGWVSREI